MTGLDIHITWSKALVWSAEELAAIESTTAEREVSKSLFEAVRDAEKSIENRMTK